MDRRVHDELIERLFSKLDGQAIGLADEVYHNDVTAYTSPDRLARERAELFRGRPQLVALSCELARPGDYVTQDIAGVPIVVVRDDDREVRALINVCRHRGARLVRDRGACKQVIHCPYHGWSYDRRGALVAMSSRGGFDGLRKQDYGLATLPVVERHGLVWVAPTPEVALDIDAHLAGLAPEIAGYRADRYHHYQTAYLCKAMNWKLAMDTFLEGYHIAVLHRRSLAKYLHGDVAAFDPFGANLRMVIPRRSFASLREIPASDRDLGDHSLIAYLLFPNIMFFKQTDHILVWRIDPGGPLGDRVDECQMKISLFTPEPATTDKARKHWDFSLKISLDITEQEDFVVGEDIQRGCYSGAQSSVVYGRNEPALAHYHRCLNDALAG